MAQRILLDLLGFTGERGGTETYVRQISRRLSATLPGAELIALTNAASVELVRSFFPGEVHPIPWVRKDRATWALGEIFAVNRYAARLGADVIWSPANFGPISRRTPLVLTFHDVVYRDWRGNLVESAIRSLAWWMMRRSAHVADIVITGSDAAAAELVEYAGVDPVRLRVVPHGTADPQPPSDAWAELEPLGITAQRPIVLSTGNRLPHKNFTGLLEAIATLEPHQRPLTVIPGAHGEDPLKEVVERLGLEADVILPGWITYPQLEALYAVATLYVCPSLTEGFGLPVIDAMRRGCPVLANDVPVLHEVGGDAASYADAGDPMTLGRAVLAVVATPRDEARIAEGVAWASKFTWDASAGATARILDEAIVVAGPRG
jgi:glycosyltransferase involved in cell wall biosynthesis